MQRQYGGLYICPDGMTVQEFLSAYSDRAKQAAQDLMRDQRMASLWGSKFSTRDFEEAVHVFELANTRGPWDALSQRQQAAWLDQFDKTTAKLLDLLKTAPCPPEAWGFPVRMEVLVEAAQRMGVEVPDAGTLRAESRLEDAVDDIGWTIAHALNHYAAQQHVAARVGQPLAKPGDAKAPRAYFLAELQQYRPNLSAAVVATVASVMFGEEVDDRKAREHRPDGFSRNRNNPS